MIQKLNWEAFTKKDRNVIINAIKEAITESDGAIMNFNMFSDVALSISIEIPADHLASLHQSLNAILNLPDLNLKSFNSNTEKELWVFLNVTFIEGKGKLRIKVPEVPG
ncbi:MAG: hypothetical protein RJQ09_00620 [Cyclobacteriaceae bacterium]